MRTLSLLPRHVACSSPTDDKRIAKSAARTVLVEKRSAAQRFYSAQQQEGSGQVSEKNIRILTYDRIPPLGTAPVSGFSHRPPSTPASTSGLDSKRLLHTRSLLERLCLHSALPPLLVASKPPWATPSIQKFSMPAFATSHRICPTTRKSTCCFMQCGVCKLKGA